MSDGDPGEIRASDLLLRRLAGEGRPLAEIAVRLGLPIGEARQRIEAAVTESVPIQEPEPGLLELEVQPEGTVAVGHPLRRPWGQSLALRASALAVSGALAAVGLFAIAPHLGGSENVREPELDAAALADDWSPQEELEALDQSMHPPRE